MNHQQIFSLSLSELMCKSFNQNVMEKIQRKSSSKKWSEYETNDELFMKDETIEQKAKINDKPLIGAIIFRLHHHLGRWQYI